MVRYCAEYAKSGRSKCKKKSCGEKICQGDLRMGKILPNPWTDSGAEMTNWFHSACFWETLKKGRSDGEAVTDEDDIDGFYELTSKDQEEIREIIQVEESTKASFEDVVYTENTSGDKEKFWEICLSSDGLHTRLRYGQIGEEGFTQIKDFDDEDAATKYYDKALSTKLNKHGYSKAKQGKYKPTGKSGAGKKGKSEGKAKSGAKAKAPSGGGGKGGDGDLPAGYPKFSVEYAKSGRSKCKGCKECIEMGKVRMGRIIPNPYTDSGAEMTQWYHLDCLMKEMEKGRSNKARIKSIDDVANISALKAKDKARVQKIVDGEAAKRETLVKAAAKGWRLEAHVEPGEKADGTWRHEEHKFYEISRAGNTTITRYGALDTDGFELSKKHKNGAAAQAWIDKKVAEKLAKIYVLVRKGKSGGGDDEEEEEEESPKKAKKVKKEAAKKPAKKRKRKEEPEDDDDDNDDEDYDSMNVAALKKACKAQGMKTGGKKADLVKRLKKG